MIDRSDVLEARRRIEGHVRWTPLLRGGSGSAPVWLKCEFMQHTGVFKARGAFNRLLAAQERGELDPAAGVVVASGGNAGLANAYAAAALGVPATVFVPTTAPKVKVERLLEYGATVRQVGAEYAEAYAGALQHAGQSGALFSHAYDQLEIAAGAGTIAEEILEDEPGIDTIVVAVGGGGLYAGLAAAAAGRAGIVAVEPSTIPTLHGALAAGRPVDVPVSGVAADSLGARRIGDIAFDIASRTPRFRCS
ncbi:threonine/serine dehydratase [Arthrobacter ginkgonis]|uniref:Threonine/serine dehydratase n=1 Tax=Arthrobacter ginkgonis TaxID=1630594 RepID=A0ABP7D3G3_9MICC